MPPILQKQNDSTKYNRINQVYTMLKNNVHGMTIAELEKELLFQLKKFWAFILIKYNLIWKKGLVMKTLTVDIQDNFIQEFLNFVEKSQNKVKLHENSGLEKDIYFYQRKEELHNIRKQVKENSNQLSSIDSIEKKFDTFEKNLESKYAN
jgi:hypothetical protein